MTSHSLSSVQKATRYAAVAALAASLATAPAIITAADSPLSVSAQAAEETKNSQTVAAGDGATVTSVKVIEEGKAIEITGKGWKHPSDGGSKIAIKADKNKTLLNGSDTLTEIEADKDGNFTATLKFPSKANGYNTDWAVGTEHTLHFLSGSLKDGDTRRFPVLKFTVAKSGEVTGDVVDQAGWTELNAAGEKDSNQATMRIRPYETGDGSKLRITGKDWTNAAKDNGSVVSIKLEYLDEDGKTVRQYSRSDEQNAISKYLTSKGKTADPTSWILLTTDESAVNEKEGIFLIKKDGSFDIEFDVPEELQKAKTGQFLRVFAQSGRNAEGDSLRKGTSKPVPVNGVAAEEPATNTAEEGTCVTDVANPTAKIETTTVEAGGKLRLTGAGWCNDKGAGAPRIAVKVDEGKISRLDTSLHSNQTIWAIIDPDPKTGTFDTWIDLPTADKSNNNVGLSDGAHSLRLLSGSFNRGVDRSVTFGGQGVLDFVVGEYKPNAVPDTVSSSDLSEANRKGVTVEKNGNQIKVTVPGAQPGQWVQANPYIDGSVRSNWGSGWVQLDENRALTYELPEGLAAGDYKLAVQSGEQEGFGDLLGWGDLKITDSSSASQNGSSSANSSTNNSGSAGNSAKGSTTAANRPAASANSGAGNWVMAPGTATSGSGLQASNTSLGRSSGTTQKVMRAPAKTQKVAKESDKKKATASASPSSSAQQSAKPEKKNQQAEATSTEKSFWQKTFSANNLLLLGAAVIILSAVLIPRKGTSK